MKPKTISQFLDLNKPIEGRTLLQARIPTELCRQIRAQLSEDGVTIQEFMEASIKAFLEEVKLRK